MNIFNVEIKKGNNHEYKENNKTIYPNKYIKIKKKDLKKYRNLIAEENIVEYQYVSDIKEQKKRYLVYIKKRIKSYQYKTKNLIESNSKIILLMKILIKNVRFSLKKKFNIKYSY